MSNLYNLELERHWFASIIKNPEQWGEVAGFTGPQDFSQIHQPFFNVVKLHLDQNPPKSIKPVILADTIKQHGIPLDGITPYEYLQAVELIPVGEDSCLEFTKEIKRLAVRRELITKSNQVAEELKRGKDKSAEEMIGLVDKTLSDINTKYYQQPVQDIFESLIEIVEERGNNPINTEDLGLMGPFDSINKTLGSIVFPGSFTVISSRSGGGKSSLGFFYNIFLAEKYGLPILHLDAAEMTIEQLQMRAVCSLSNGRVPLWAVKSGEWRKNKEWVDIIRGDVWPRVKKIKIYFQNIGGFSPKEMVSFCKRFYYNKAGRENHLLIHWDYIKGTESVSKNASEHQVIGFMVGDMKTMITDEIKASVWTSVQANRSGIYTGKSSGELRDSEDAISLSDRIIQQSTNGFMMRYKVPDELAYEGNMFGNVKLNPVKERELLGKNYQDMLAPVKIKDGKDIRMVKNYFNLDTRNFYYEDKGDLRKMAEMLAKAPVKLKDDDSDQKPAF